MTSQTKDVIIAGGGLAGLSLAYQLKITKPELDVLVVERNKFPVPEKTAKVGESTVEIGARYLNHTLGLKEHFSERHLRKHGLRCFFGAPQDDFAGQDELGVSQLFGIPTYQIDRGAIENYLQSAIREQGVEVLDGVSTQSIELTEKMKSVTVKDADVEKTFSGRWLVDAAGRQALIKNKLDLKQESAHKGNALWFRIDRQVKIDDWSNDENWKNRVKQKSTRWLSTNHLMGPGYWVWVIPLDNGATSIGIVMDDQAFADGNFSNIDTTMDWLRVNQPHCAHAVEGAEVLDFVVINDYSHGCKQMFSDQGWGVTGESGVFADPFYSPGSDFIALNNTFINDLICRSARGENIHLESRLYQGINQSFFDSTLSLYTGQYGGFGDRRMMSLKLVWDYAYYWGVLSLLFFKSAITDVSLMRDLKPVLLRSQQANAMVQEGFRRRAEQRLILPAQGLFLDQYLLPCLRHFNKVLIDENVSTKLTIMENVEILERLKGYLLDMLREGVSNTISDDERSLLGEYRRCVLA
jgi:flavin-dependent dehydrogenase